MKPHPHAELIKAWADGAEIQAYSSAHDEWRDIDEHGPFWHPFTQYRIKPQPKPDVVEELCLWFARGCVDRVALAEPNVRFTFDGETGKLKSAEVL